MPKLMPQTVNEVYAEHEELKSINTDLLAALKAAIPFLEAEQRKSDFEVLPLAKARAAIAKARNQ